MRLAVLNKNDAFSRVHRSGLVIVFLFVAERLVAFLPGEMNSFIADHYLFSYAAGFHKRALVGELLSLYWYRQQLNAVDIYAISLCVLAVFAVALVLFIRRALLASWAILVLGLVLLGSPAILPHFAYAIGYFDSLHVLCALLALLALAAPMPDWGRVAAAFAPCAVGVLIHESFLLTAFPLVVASTLITGAPRRVALWFLVGSVAALTVLVQLSGPPSLSVEQYMSMAAARTDLRLEPEGFTLLYFHLSQNWAYLLKHYSGMATVVLLVAGLLLPIPYFMLLRDLFRITTTRAGLTDGVRVGVAACILAPLALMLVGFDTLRWVSFVCLNCSLIVLALVRMDSAGEVKEAISSYVGSARFAVLALLSLALGPLHVVEGNGVATGARAAAHGLGLVP
jgi:hypothetical protein